MGVAIILSLAYFLDKKVSRETINKNILYFFVACTLGGVILILAPGNYVRLDTISSGRYANMFGNIIYLIIEIITKPSNTAII